MLTAIANQRRAMKSRFYEGKFEPNYVCFFRTVGAFVKPLVDDVTVSW